jgi:hypothetical protein
MLFWLSQTRREISRASKRGGACIGENIGCLTDSRISIGQYACRRERSSNRLLIMASLGVNGVGNGK